MPQVRRLAAEFVRTPVGELERLLDPTVARGPDARPGDHGRAVSSAPTNCTKRPCTRPISGRTARINSWDLVDVTAPGVVGAHLVTRSRQVLRRLARSENLWERRIAIVSTFAFIRRNEFDDTLAIAERLLEDRHDLIHKAVGWMLREVGKRDEEPLRRFLDQHAAVMPRTMLRYAIERLSPASRRAYMTKR